MKEETCFILRKHKFRDVTHLKLGVIHTHTLLFLSNQAQHGYL